MGDELELEHYLFTASRLDVNGYKSSAHHAFGTGHSPLEALKDSRLLQEWVPPREDGQYRADAIHAIRCDDDIFAAGPNLMGTDWELFMRYPKGGTFADPTGAPLGVWHDWGTIWAVQAINVVRRRTMAPGTNGTEDDPVEEDLIGETTVHVGVEPVLNGHLLSEWSMLEGWDDIFIPGHPYETLRGDRRSYIEHRLYYAHMDVDCSALAADPDVIRTLERSEDFTLLKHYDNRLNLKFPGASHGPEAAHM